MPTIDISDSLYRQLLSRTISFEDQPEDVIARLLVDAGDVDGAERDVAGRLQPATRATPGSVLPVQAYWLPILEVLEEAGGAAHSSYVIEALGDRMQSVLTPGDFEPLKSGEIRWRNRARFARLRMKERGLLSDKSHRGIWEITPEGRKFLAAVGASGGP